MCHGRVFFLLSRADFLTFPVSHSVALEQSQGRRGRHLLTVPPGGWGGLSHVLGGLRMGAGVGGHCGCCGQG